jgi:hypothetical protein
MVFSLTFKTPDVLQQLDDVPGDDLLEACLLAEQYVKWQEYVTLVFDTDKQTVIVEKTK